MGAKEGRTVIKEECQAWKIRRRKGRTEICVKGEGAGEMLMKERKGKE